MLLMHRNLKPIWYALWLSETDLEDSDKYETGESENSYSAPVKMMCNISPERSYVVEQPFGPMDPYDIVILTDDMNCPVTETSVFWDHEPAADEAYQYIVRRVSKNLNHIAITLRKVMVS